MNKIRAVVIDDEVKSREVIKTLLHNFCENVEVVDEAGDIESGIRVIEEEKPDLVFLDITLKEGDSFQILQGLGKIDFDIIFVTAYDEYSVKALKFSGITCLFKPLDIQELQDAVKEVFKRPTDMGLAYEMVNGMLKSKFKRIPIITSGGLYFADVADITIIVQDEEFVKVHFRNGDSVQSERTVEEFVDVIFNNEFAKIGSRLLIHTMHFKPNMIKGSDLVYANGPTIVLSRDEKGKIESMFK